MTAPLRIAIAGLGRVGAQAPAVRDDAAKAPIVRNHLDAVLAEGRCRLVALIDADDGARDRVKRRAQLPRDVGLLASLDDLAAGSVDVVVLSTPADTRRETVEQALALAPGLIIVEKPLAGDSAEAEAILALARDAGTALRVNFNRRLDPALQKFRALMPAPPVAVVCRYNNGLFNYASHMVDLLCHWFGPVSQVQAMQDEISQPDPTLSFCCRFAAGFEAVFVGVPGAAYDQFEAELLFSSGAVTLTNNGVEKRFLEAVDDHYYPGYAHLVEAPGLREFSRTGGFAELYRAVAEHFLEGAALPGCTGEEGLACLDILEAVLSSCRQNGVPVKPVDRHNWKQKRDLQ